MEIDRFSLLFLVLCLSLIPFPSLGSSSYYVALIGDSLLNKPCGEHNLIGKIQALLPDYSLTFENYANNGAKIASVLSNLPPVIATSPDAYVLFWDSDCSDINEMKLSQEAIDAVRLAYTNNLIEVIEQILATGSYLMVMGPEVLGEGMVGLPGRFWGKTTMLDDYREINRDTCETYGVDYIDVRKAFLDKIPFYHVYYKWYLTQDGEHENERGTQVVAELIANSLRDNWLSKLKA